MIDSRRLFQAWHGIKPVRSVLQRSSFSVFRRRIRTEDSSTTTWKLAQGPSVHMLSADGMKAEMHACMATFFTGRTELRELPNLREKDVRLLIKGKARGNTHSRTTLY